MNQQPCKTDQRAAERALKKAVAIARADLAIAASRRDDPDAYARVFIKNVERFDTAVLAAALHVESVPAKPAEEVVA